MMALRAAFARRGPVTAMRFSSSNAGNKQEGVVERQESQVPVRPAGQAQTAAVVSGAPEELFSRPIRIFRPTPTTMQSSDNDVDYWRLDWDVLQGGGRWENPMMGWASSADYMQGTRLKFKTAEEAVHFCEKQGWPYYVQQPKKMKFTPKSYANNFVHSEGKLRIVKTK